MININIIWDFDGTLFDTYPALVEGFIQLSGKNLDYMEVLTWLKKDSKTAFKHYGISESRRAEYQKLYNFYSQKNSRPFPYVEEALAVAEHNIIITHRDKASTILLLEKYNLKKYFSEIVSVEEDGFNRKPDISSYRYVLKKYNVDLTVGDRELDLIPAKKLHIKTAAFQNGHILADYYLESHRDFHKEIRNHFS